MNRVGHESDAVARVAAVHSFLRQRERALSPRELVGKVAYQVYVVLLFGGLYGMVVLRTVGTPSLGSRTELSARAGDALLGVIVALAFLATVLGVRVGTWAGPVLVSRAEAAWLLPAPLDRRRLLRRDLAWGLVGYGVTGSLVGALVGTLVSVETGAGVSTALLGSVVGWGALGVVTGGLALAVESSRRLAQIALRATVLFVVLGAGVVWLSLAGPALAVWATPWGWATAPVATAVGVDVPLPWLPLALLLFGAVVAVQQALRRLPAVPDEELVRRAGSAEGVRASAAIFDARAIAQARRSGQRALVEHRRVRIRRPRHRWQLVPWRDLVSLLRRPGVMERTLVAVVVAATLVWWARGGVVAVVGAVLLVSMAAGQLLEPLRIELEEPVVKNLTRLTPGDLALEHLAMPTVVLAAFGGLVATVAAAATILPWSALPAAVLASIDAGALFAAVAGLASTRGAPPLQWLISTGDYGALLLVGWLLAGPLLAIALGVPAVLAVMAALHDGADPMQAVARPTLPVVATAIGLALVTRWRARKRTGG